jgi:hypothetical protein
MTSDRKRADPPQRPVVRVFERLSHTPYPSRWIQDRQNLVSLYHDKIGVILGGGNTKLQPLWSTFSVGDRAQFHHKAGDETPISFRPVLLSRASGCGDRPGQHAAAPAIWAGEMSGAG